MCFYGGMTTETAPIAPTNQDVAAKIGLTHSGVSRIRSGDRLPSIPTMARIETVYGWTVQDQVSARGTGKYAEEFEGALIRSQRKAS